ncbi:MAG TPA: DoxX family protein [Silvibacterium sp.]|jgi:putative oxidoreductase|nr:DoxX family protein [Silvibacterium sp.]
MSTSSASLSAANSTGLGWLYGRFCALARLLRSPFLLFVRLYWGWQFIQTGWGKLHNLSHVTEFFASLHIPAPGLMAPAISCLEFFGGILLIVGLGTRLIGLLLSCNMLVAYITGDLMALKSIFSDPGKFYVADPFTFLFASLIAFIFGAGLFSLDAAIDKAWLSRKGITSS